MSRIRNGFLAAAAGAIVAIAQPLDAMAFGRGGGGGGGGRGGGMHVAPSFSRSPTFSVRSFPGAGIRSGMPGAGMSLRANRSFGVTQYGAHSLGGANRVGTTRGALMNAGMRNPMMRDGHLANGGLVRTNGMAWRNGAWNGMRWAHRGDWWRHRPFFGWAGPVFWPWFYDDFFFYTFWDYGPYYDDPFWAYGYDDIYGAMFSPYGYDGLADWAPPRATQPHAAVARRTSPSRPGEARDWSAMCGSDTQVASVPIDRIAAAVSPDQQQRAALDVLANASVQAAQTIKTACPREVAFTPTGRLDAMERRVQAMAQAIAMIRPPVETFYGSLRDDQKARLDTLGQTQRQDNPRSPLAACGPNAAAIPTWPQGRIEQAVRPNEDQRALLGKLRDANAKAADMLKASCLVEPPTTPPERVAAMTARLDALLGAVQLVHGALDDFYGALDDGQKAQFNGIPPMLQNGAKG